MALRLARDAPNLLIENEDRIAFNHGFKLLFLAPGLIHSSAASRH